MDISRYTGKDHLGRCASDATVRDMMNPVYSGSQRMNELRPAWHEKPDLHRRFLLDHMEPGEAKCVDGAEVYRKKTANKWLVAGQDYYLDAAVEALAAELSTGKPPRPFYKLAPMQKKILRFWRDYEDANGDVPVVSEASRGLKMSVQLIGGLITEMGEWGICYKDGGLYGDHMTHWHCYWDKLRLVEF